jgi:[CysO sulfur-carrier protein]-S-L-cysteine hydrolase
MALRTELALSLGEGITAELLALADRARPAEACAVLSGPDPMTAATVHPARNAAHSPYRYELDPADLVSIVGEIEDRGAEMVAIFHSHPAGEAVPSATDVREARWDVVHVIAAGSDDESVVRGWRIRDGRAREVALLG